MWVSFCRMGKMRKNVTGRLYSNLKDCEKSPVTGKTNKNLFRTVEKIKPFDHSKASKKIETYFAPFIPFYRN